MLMRKELNKLIATQDITKLLSLGYEFILYGYGNNYLGKLSNISNKSFYNQKKFYKFTVCIDDFRHIPACISNMSFEILELNNKKITRITEYKNIKYYKLINNQITSWLRYIYKYRDFLVNVHELELNPIQLSNNYLNVLKFNRQKNILLERLYYNNKIHNKIFYKEHLKPWNIALV